MTFDPRLPDPADAFRLGQSFPCIHCDDLVDGITAPATEDGEAHLACAIAAGELDAHVCRVCSSHSETETDAHGRCPGCAEIAEEEARAAEARRLAIRAAAESLGYSTARILRGVVAMHRVGQPYASSHGELHRLRELAKLGLVQMVRERVSRSPVASSRHWIPTEGGIEVSTVRASIEGARFVASTFSGKAVA